MNYYLTHQDYKMRTVYAFLHDALTVTREVDVWVRVQSVTLPYCMKSVIILRLYEGLKDSKTKKP